MINEPAGVKYRYCELYTFKLSSNSLPPLLKLSKIGRFFPNTIYYLTENHTYLSKMKKSINKREGGFKG